MRGQGGKRLPALHLLAHRAALLPLAKAEFTAMGLTVRSSPGTSVMLSTTPPMGRWKLQGGKGGEQQNTVGQQGQQAAVRAVSEQTK